MRRIFGHIVLDELSEIVKPKHAAVLIVDVQNDFCSAGGFFDRQRKDLSMIQAMITRLAAFVKEARAHGVPVVFVQQTTEPEGCSDSGAWLRLKTRGGSDGQYTIAGSWGHEFVPGLEPTQEEAIIPKTRSSAFTRTHLFKHLTDRGIRSVIVTGTTTQGCVESTARDATFHDFYAVLPVDLVASTRRDLHEASLLVQSVRHEMTTSSEIVSIWKQQHSMNAERREPA